MRAGYNNILSLCLRHVTGQCKNVRLKYTFSTVMTFKVKFKVQTEDLLVLAQSKFNFL